MTPDRTTLIAEVQMNATLAMVEGLKANEDPHVAVRAAIVRAFQESDGTVGSLCAALDIITHDSDAEAWEDDEDEGRTSLGTLPLSELLSPEQRAKLPASAEVVSVDLVLHQALGCSPSDGAFEYESLIEYAEDNDKADALELDVATVAASWLEAVPGGSAA